MEFTWLASAFTSLTGPRRDFIVKAFFLPYAQGAAKAGREIRINHLLYLEFDPDFKGANTKNQQPLEQDLKDVLGNLV